MISLNFRRPFFNCLHTFCFSYLCLIKLYVFCVSIIITTLFLQVLSRIFMKMDITMCDAHVEGSMCT